jgi:hypothetical protein
MIMENIYIRHKNNKDCVLLCDENYNPIDEEAAGTTRPRNKAFYVRFPDGFIGVYSSDQGPVLFVNANKFLFTDPSWSVSVRKKGTQNEVKFVDLFPVPQAFECPAVELDPLDPWSEEQFDDFFIWLTKKRDDREFIDMWTDKG